MDYNKYLDNLMSEAKFFKAKKKPNLFSMENLLTALNNPDLTPKFRTIVTGTAGKGTVCRYIENYALKNNLTVITLVSPHIQTPLERIRVNGKIILQSDFENQIKKIIEASDKINIKPTYFEAIVLIAILLADEMKIDLLNCEVGLGGKYDACNAIKGRRYSAITFIGDDHKEIIGPEIKDIAIEKSGIITKDSIYTISYEKQFREIFNSKGKVEYIEYETPKISNKTIAKKIIQKILTREDIVEADDLQLPCRFEEIVKNIYLDGAHSKPRFQDIENKLSRLNEKFTVIFAMTASHDPHELNIIKKYIDKLIITHVKSHRSFWTIKELQSILGPNAIEIENPIEALNEAKKFNNKILVIGSFYLCGIIREKYISTQEIIENRTEFKQ
jgi:dihydrofolate synthase/folylpolyglutamate synthase